MSAAHGKSTTGRGLDALSIAVVFGILYAGANLAPGYKGAATLLGALSCSRERSAASSSRSSVCRT